MNLLPCPFCGGTAHLVKEEFSDMSFLWIECDECRACTTQEASSPERAQTLWNIRITGET